MSVAWLFPGQGSQSVGMGRALAERYADAARVYHEANEALGFDVRRLCFEGPEEELQRTANAQPALLATSIAALRAAREELGNLAPPAFLAGHSLGEFSALVAADVIDFPEALRLVRRRGELMQQAAEPDGGMAAVLGLDGETVAAAIEGTGCVVANDNAPGQVVISGSRAALASATHRLDMTGARRVIPLKVSAAFHSPAMRPVADTLAAEMSRLGFRDARTPIVSNVDAEPRAAGADLAAFLARQVYSPVQWTAVVRRMLGERVERFVEFGPGTVLTGLVKRMAPSAQTANVSDPRSLGEARAALR